jgi:hypothetical protein
MHRKEQARCAIQGVAGRVLVPSTTAIDSSASVSTLRYPVATNPDEAFFWSGRTNGIGGATSLT